MGFLRLITNRQVMGADGVTQKQAWQIYRILSEDERVTFLNEPSGIENEWQRRAQSGSSSTNTWTDTYLAAFALVRGLKIVSFDTGFERIPGLSVITL